MCVIVAPDVHEKCSKNVSKNEEKELRNVLGAYWCRAAAAER